MMVRSGRALQVPELSQLDKGVLHDRSRRGGTCVRPDDASTRLIYIQLADLNLTGFRASRLFAAASYRFLDLNKNSAHKW